MKRTPLALLSTLTGLVGVTAAHLLLPAPSLLASPSATPMTPATKSPSTTSTVSPGSTTTTPKTTRQPSSTPLSATGSLVNYSYGTISVKATLTGSKISAISVASLNDGGNPYSQQLDSAAIPQLVQEALAVQSANIQGVSGASYTSAGFATSLQSALKKLGK